MLFSSKFSQTERLGELFEAVLYKRVGGDEVNKPWYLPGLIIKPPGASEDFSPKIDNWRRDSKVPILILNATTLNTGHTWQFTASFMGEPAASINTEIDAGERLRRMYYSQEGVPQHYRNLRLGHAVAASAAVPLLFDPLEFRDLFPDRVVRLSDGGVHDNQGAASLLEQDCNVLLVSDASGQMGTQEQPGQGHLAVFYRANEILQERVRWAGHEELEALKSAGVLRELMFVHLKKDLDSEIRNWAGNNERPDPPDDPQAKLPEQVVFAPTRYGVLKHVQRKLSALRTDLDSFTDQEAYALMLSGYRMVDLEFATQLRHLSPNPDSKAEKWRFQQASDILQDPFLDRPLLDVGHLVFGKPWRLSSSLRAVVRLSLLVGVLEIGWALAGWAGLTKPTLLDAGQKLIVVLAAAAVATIIAGGLLVLTMRFLRVRRSPTQIALNVFLCIGGALIFRFYLKFLAPWYLEQGRLREPNPKPARTLRLISTGVIVAFVGIAVLLFLQVGNPFSSTVRVQALVRHASRLMPAEPGQALLDYDLAVDLSSSMSAEQRGGLYAQRAYAKRTQRDYAGALMDLQQAVALQPNNAQNWRDLGYVNRLLGHLEEALQSYQTSLTWEPDERTKDQIKKEQDYCRSLLPAVGTVPATPAPYLYIHVADKALVPRLDGLVQALRRQDIQVPSIQVVGAVPEHTQLRHLDTKTDSEGASKLVKGLDLLGVKSEATPLRTGTGVSNRFELWVGKDNPLLQK
jgi:predicted acylesterase/phospholipase RssA